jgi:outer membrane lipoprotein-sorting protein
VTRAARIGVALLCAVLAASTSAMPRKGKFPPDLAEILARMNEAAKRLKTVSANLEYTKVTVLVNDRSVEEGQFFFRKGKTPDILISIQKPDPKYISFRKNKAEIYLPKISQAQEYNLEQSSGLVQQFLLLGFGTETGELKKSYTIKFVKEEDIGGDTCAVLELVPKDENVAAQVTKIHLWISEESWLPIQQQFFEPGGDYLIAKYSGVKVNRVLPSSTFRIPYKGDVKRVQMR